MRHGFVKVAAATPDIRVADVEFNKENICRGIEEAEKANAKILVFPELCVTGYTCSDLFDHAVLLKAAKKALLEIAEFTRDRDLLVFVGVPLEVDGKLYNVAAALNHGKILGLTTKTFLPNYGEFYEMRQFTPGPEKARYISFNGEEIPFGPQLLFQAAEMEDLIVAAEICEDVWSPVPPSIGAALEGATVIVNCSASDETIGKDTYRRELIAGQSARLIAGYIYANAGEGESTTDLVFGGHNIIAENGTILKESNRYRNEIIYSEFDLERITGERRKNTTFQTAQERSLIRVGFQIEKGETSLTRTFPKKPFVPSDEQTRAARCEEILTIQAMGLKKRLAHTNARTAVVGISGGLDSTLALLVTAKAFDMLGRDKKDIPLIFIRPRNLEQMLKFKDILEENKDIITGIVIPKANGEKIDSFIESLEKINCLKLYIMPIIESIEFIDYTLKDKYLKDLKRAVLKHRNKILNIRVGVTDILGSYGIRRDKSLTIYDNIVFKNLTFDLMSILKNDEIDIPISGGVSEVYDMNKKDILNTFIKEVKIDKLNGFIGKTVIHPFQMNVVQAMNVISYEDYMDAKSILDGVGSKYSISGSINCERMNEVNPHTKWAKKIMLLSDIYGVFNKGISFNELFRF